VWKITAAGLVAVVLIGWFAARELTRREPSTPRSPDIALAKNASKESRNSAESTSETSVNRVSIPDPTQSTQLTVRVANARTKEPVADMELHVRAVRRIPPFDGVHIRNGEEVTIASGKSDSDGQASFNVLAGVPLRVDEDGKGDGSAISGSESPIMWGHVDVDPLSPGERRMITIEAHDEREYTFWARCISDEDAQPIPDLVVRALDESELWNNFQVTPDWGKGPSTHLVRGNGDGVIDLEMNYFQRALLTLLVAGRGFGPALFRPDSVHVSRDNALELKLSRSGSLEGRVNDLRGQQPSNLTVELRTETYNLRASDDSDARVFGYEFVWRAACDTQGNFSFPVLPSRAHYKVDVRVGERVVLTLPGGGPDSLAIKPGEARHVEWEIGGGTAVHGLTLDKDGQPLRGHEIWLLRYSIDAIINPGATCSLRADDSPQVVARAKTDEQGRFEFVSVEAREWYVGIAPAEGVGNVHSESDASPIAVKFEIAPGAKEVNVTIQPASTLFIRGIVLQPDGTPMSKASVEMGRPGNYLLERATSNEKGVFEIGPLEAGAWRLRANAWGCHARSDEVDVEAGASNVTLRLKPSGSISGEIRSNPLQPNEIVYLRVSAERGPTVSTPSGGAAQFLFEGLDPGKYVVTARTSTGRVGAATGLIVRAGETTGGIIIDLMQGGTIRARYRGKEESCSLWILCDGTVIDCEGVNSGSWKKITVPLGQLTIRRITEHGNVDQDVMVRAGADIELELVDP
jgi:hypothetical protein